MEFVCDKVGRPRCVVVDKGGEELFIFGRDDEVLEAQIAVSVDFPCIISTLRRVPWSEAERVGGRGYRAGAWCKLGTS